MASDAGKPETVVHVPIRPRPILEVGCPDTLGARVVGRFPAEVHFSIPFVVRQAREQTPKLENAETPKEAPPQGVEWGPKRVATLVAKMRQAAIDAGVAFDPLSVEEGRILVAGAGPPAVGPRAPAGGQP